MKINKSKIEFTLNKDTNTKVLFVNSTKNDFGIELEKKQIAKSVITVYKAKNKDEANYITVGTKNIKELYEYREIAGELGRLLDKNNLGNATIYNLSKEQSLEVIEGIILGTHYLELYKSKPRTCKLEEISFDNVSLSNEEIDLVKEKALATIYARELSQLPGTDLTSEDYANIASKVFKNTNVNVTIFDGEELKKRTMNGILAVNRGSKYDPKLIILEYCTDDTLDKVALVGKGLTFDMGGYSIKTARDNSGMRVDMGGSASVFGAIYQLQATKAKANVIAVIPTTDNLINSNALLPGDVIKYNNGVSVQVGNTDAEGRLILADGLIYVQEQGAKHVVDVATLTGSIVASLGPSLAGLFTNNDTSLKKLQSASKQTGERVWHMPLVEDYVKTLKSDYADIKNISNMPKAGSITAGLFLRHFINDGTSWAHLDIAGVTDQISDEADKVQGMTGFGVKLLSAYVESFER